MNSRIPTHFPKSLGLSLIPRLLNWLKFYKKGETEIGFTLAILYYRP